MLISRVQTVAARTHRRPRDQSLQYIRRIPPELLVRERPNDFDRAPLRSVLRLALIWSSAGLSLLLLLLELLLLLLWSEVLLGR